jgi:hypothetical protein
MGIMYAYLLMVKLEVEKRMLFLAYLMLILLSFTMQGPPNKPGIMPRAMELLFKTAGRDAGRFNISFECCMIEIYNDQLIDLLSGNSEETGKLSIKKDSTASSVFYLKLTK